MAEQSTTPDPLELTRRQFAAVNRRNLDAVMSVCPSDGVYDTSPSGLGVFEGPVAIRGFLQDWWNAFEELVFELEEALDLGSGLVFLVVRQDARPAAAQVTFENAKRTSLYGWTVWPRG